MQCAACGSENLLSARFCQACGARLVDQGGAATAVAVRPPRPAPPPPRPHAPSVRPVLLLCPSCGQPARPMPYFSRGVNIAKAMVLMVPFNVFGPMLFFFMRKDRFICGACSRLLSGEAAIPLLQTFSADGGAGYVAALPGGGSSALALYDPNEDLAVLQHQSRRQRARAWSLGAAAAGLAGVGAMAGIGPDGHIGTTLFFMAAAAPAAIGAAVAALRSRSFARRFVMKRGREQRARVLELARAAGGRLSVSGVAADLRIELADAESLLNAMVDGHRVEMEVDDEGRISYLFTELTAG
jgi:hypothetical protein